MTAPLVSVLMTAYNREKYIEEAIESVLAQTFTDFELIIVDDASKDRSLVIASRYTSDPRVRVYLNEQNLGDYPNRNRAAQFARGRYLKYLDSDDLMYPHCLEIMTRQMEQFAEGGIGFEGEKEADWPRPFPFVLSPAEVYRDHFFGRGVLSQGPTRTIIRTDVFREFGGFRPERYTGDTEFWFRVTRKKPLVICYSGLTWWRQHPEQQIKSELLDCSVVVRRYRLGASALTARDCPLAQRERRLALKRIRRKYLRRVASALAHGKLLLAWFLYKGIGDNSNWGHDQTC
jgi:glycosyltransferase involved in cell wall biosynthesis